MRYTLLFLFLFSTVAVQSQSFTTVLSKSKVSIGETFKVSFQLKNANGSGFIPPDFGELTVLQGPSTENMTQIVNGSISSSISYSYLLQAKKEGTFGIGPASITVNGNKMMTAPVSVTAVKGAANPKDDIYAQIADNLFVRVILSKKETWVGEQIFATIKLYSNVNFYNLETDGLPSYSGFLAQKVDLPDNLPPSQEILNGVKYQVYIIQKSFLFPQKSGELTIDPIDFSCIVKVRKEANPWGGFGGIFNTYVDYPFNFSSLPIKVKVKPLPEPKPADFSGAVGIFSLTTSIDKTEAKTDDAITLKLKLSGEGNIRLMDAPVITLPNDFEVFEPKVSENLSTGSNTITGTKTYDYLIIPRRPGDFKIDPVTVSYFDVQKEKYITLSSESFLLKIDGEASSFTGSGSQSIKKENIELLGQDIRYIQLSVPLRKTGNILLFSPAFISLSVFPFILFGGLVWFRRRAFLQANDVAALRKKKAKREALKRLQKAAQMATGGRSKEFFDELSRAMWGYFSDKFLLDSASLSRDQLKNILVSSGQTQQTIILLNEILDAAEMALYAPAAVSGSPESFLNKAEQVITAMEEVKQ